MRYQNLTYRWFKAQKKYRNLQRRLQSASDTYLIKKLLSKIEHIKQRLLNMNKRWKLGVATSVLVAWLAANPAQAQFNPPVELDSLNGTSGFTINGINAYDRLGLSVSITGDINNDGFDDVIIAAPGNGTNESLKLGKVYIVFGKNTGFSSPFDLSTLDGSNGFVIDSLQTSNGQGITTSRGGDINSDGIDDIIIGARYTDTVLYGRKGATYVIFGKSSAFASSMDITALNGTDGFVINGVASNDQSGTAVSAADVNGDGFSDVIIGASYHYVPSYSSAGRAYVLFGQATFSPAVELSTLNGTNGFVIERNVSNGQLGKQVSNLGDVNGDGVDDIIIGSGYTTSQSFVLFGLSAPWPGIVDLTGLTGTDGFSIDGLSNYNGSHPVSGAGDLNDDGYNDIIVSDPSVGLGGGSTQEGISYVIFGKNTGFTASFDIATIDGNNGFQVNGERTGENSGSYLSQVGDINGDGIDDVLVVAGWEDKSYVIFGKTTPFAPSFNLSSIDGANGIDIIGDELRAVDGRGDINGDGVDDIIWGNYRAQSQPNTYDNQGRAYVLFGDNTPDTFDPVIAKTLPLNSATNVNTATNLIITFNEYIKIGTGNITILKASDDSVVETIDVASAEVVISGRTATVNPVNKLGAQEDYYIQIDAAAFDDSFGNSFAGISDKTSWVFTSVGANDFPSSIDLGTLDGTNGFTFSGIGGDDYGSVNNAGDFNGDGLDDIIMSYPYVGVDSSEVYIVFGDATGFVSPFDLSALDGSDGILINNFPANTKAGYGGYGTGGVSSAGDINGDGIDDIIIGAAIDWSDTLNNYGGEVYVVFGSDAGFTPSFDASTLDGNNGFVINNLQTKLDTANNETSNTVAFHVSGGFDLNGDNIDDVIIGAEESWVGAADGAGKVYVVFGTSAGFAATLDASSLDGNNGFTIDGLSAYSSLGNLVSPAGDINGDGIDDVIISAYDTDPNGAVHILFGNSAGFGSSFDLTTLDGSNGFTVTRSFGDEFGVSASNLGDVNGDGIDDFIIGSYYGSSGVGESYVIFGQTASFSTQLDISSLDGSNGFKLVGESIDDYAGFSVSGAGDVNGDGFNDIMVGAPTATVNGIAEVGKTYIVFGKNSPFGATFNLSSIDGTNGFIIAGVNQEDYAGFNISDAGDINGDGVDDVIVGGYYGGTNVIFGISSQAETAGVSTQHYNALVDLYNSTDGSNWTDETNWIVSDSVSTWVGIGVTGTDVISISLPDNNIIGSVPASIINITTLQVLNIANNQIETLPDLTSLVNLDTLDVSGNNLDFASLELNASIPVIEYTDQQPPMVAAIDTVVYVGQPYELNVSVSGNLNNYQWFKDSVAMSGEINDTLSIAIVNRASMGSFYAEVTNDNVPGLVIRPDENRVLAAADISGTVKDSQGAALDDGIVRLLKVQLGVAFDSTAVFDLVPGNGGVFSFPKTILADYVFLANVDTLQFPETLPSYWRSTIFWEEADTLLLNANESSIDITVLSTPPDDPGGDGVILGTVFEDLPPSSGRLAARRKLPKASVSARRKRGASKGNGLQEDIYDLIGYVFTDEEGNYEISGLPPGTYRFNVQYPGIPMDTVNSNVDIVITDSGAEVSKLVIATVTEDGIILETTPTGLDKRDYQRWMDVYPVPSSKMLFVKLDQYRHVDVLITVKTITGSTVLSEVRSLSPDNPVPIELNIGALEGGVYLLEIESTKDVGGTPLVWRTRFIKSEN